MRKVFLKNNKMKKNVNEGWHSTKKYNDNNLFDIKLRDYSIINFSDYKMKMLDEFRKIPQRKIPSLMRIYCQTFEPNFKDEDFNSLAHEATKSTNLNFLCVYELF